MIPLSLAIIAEELEREHASRQRTYPGRVDSARMTQDEATRQLALCQAWRADVARLDAYHRGAPARWQRAMAGAAYDPPPPAEHGFTWRDRVDGLRRELALRARFYPGWVAEARMTQQQADHRTACLEALLRLYEDGFDWRATSGSGPAFAEVRPNAAQAQARREWDVHMAAVTQRRNPAEQQALAL